jgi:hypothetical protein
VLLEQLLGAVRPEFRAEVLVVATADPVFGGGACRVESWRALLIDARRTLPRDDRPQPGTTTPTR